jgi:DNA-binding CsgD family transcriptional regulator
MPRNASAGRPLSPRQIEILKHYAQIGDTAATARSLRLAESTVKNTLTDVHRQLGVTSSITAVWMVFVEPQEGAMEG